MSCSNRLKNGRPISSEEYRIKPSRDSLSIYEVTEKDAGNYTVVMTNKITREVHSQTFQLLVNGNVSIIILLVFFSPFFFLFLASYFSFLYCSFLFSSFLTFSISILPPAHPKIFEKELPFNQNVHMFGSSPTLTCTAFGGSSPVSIHWQWMPSEDCPAQFQ